MPEFIHVTKKDGVHPGQVKNYYKEGKSIAVANIGGSYYAFEDSCPHMSARLSNGSLEGSIITCPEHSSKFDVTTGKPLSIENGPLVTYEVKVEGNDVLVKV
ncbi:MAG TPA: Rieske 2Fe-2S domain-containing protein [Methanocella sp.]|uniref:Rieske (2Fe-2S) protein n=1 Tax=Methanocella sp. TaxID=2052833 RepID=UPI002CA4CF99|nr:Rieske 2Fe-2S domain-containing protein [Methanocella sp.]HTY90943.1 Rieske 2Fe-2S domain-containing protein [Methanocella sp.]